MHIEEHFSSKIQVHTEIRMGLILNAVTLSIFFKTSSILMPFDLSYSISGLWSRVFGLSRWDKKRNSSKAHVQSTKNHTEQNHTIGISFDLKRTVKVDVTHGLNVLRTFFSRLVVESEFRNLSQQSYTRFSLILNESWKRHMPSIFFLFIISQISS